MQETFEKMIPVCYNVRHTHDLPLHWKNNNLDFMNHILTMDQNWPPKNLPDLVEKNHKEVKFQETLIRGALCGHGDHELANLSDLLKLREL